MKWSDRMVNLWVRVSKYSLINGVISVVFAIFFYYSFGKVVHFHGRYLEVDFFNTVCGIFTIIGLGIALYQIAALKREEEIVAQTTKAILTEAFKRENSTRIGEAKKVIADLDNAVRNSDFNAATLTAMSNRTEQIIRVFKDIDIQQDGSGGAIIIDCKKCLTLLVQLRSRFNDVIENNLFGTFPKNDFRARIDYLRDEIEKCDVALKKR